MLRYIYLKIQKYVINFFSNCAFSVKIDFKQWLQEVKSPYTYFSLIRLILNLYDMYIMYS